MSLAVDEGNKKITLLLHWLFVFRVGCTHTNTQEIELRWKERMKKDHAQDTGTNALTGFPSPFWPLLLYGISDIHFLNMWNSSQVYLHLHFSISI